VDDNKQHIELSWRILEAKLMYYRPELVHKSWHSHLAMTDSQYDAMEDTYRVLCERLNKKCYAVDMVGFDLERPSGRLVCSKYQMPKAKVDKLNLPPKKRSAV
jgi:hypothetical protein